MGPHPISNSSPVFWKCFCPVFPWCCLSSLAWLLNQPANLSQPKNFMSRKCLLPKHTCYMCINQSENDYEREKKKFYSWVVTCQVNQTFSADSAFFTTILHHVKTKVKNRGIGYLLLHCSAKHHRIINTSFCPCVYFFLYVSMQ